MLLHDRYAFILRLSLSKAFFESQSQDSSRRKYSAAAPLIPISEQGFFLLRPRCRREFFNPKIYRLFWECFKNQTPSFQSFQRSPTISFPRLIFNTSMAHHIFQKTKVTSNKIAPNFWHQIVAEYLFYTFFTRNDPFCSHYKL